MTYRYFADILQQMNSYKYYGAKYKCPICNGTFSKLLPGGVIKRPNAICPRCHSYERHRALWLYFMNKTTIFTRKMKILHFAPEPCFQKQFKKMNNLEYISADLFSSVAMIKMDITNIIYPDNMFDCVLCSHVLEHIEDDMKAIRELFRVLKPGGWAILQVPINNTEKTYEDPSIKTPEERLKYFGQEDHVRNYGLDYKERLIKAGFAVTLDTYIFDLPENMINYYRLVPEGENREYIYYCSK